MRWVRFLSVALILPAACWAQSVNWSPSKGTFEKGAQSRLSLVFKDCDPEGDMRIPQVDDLDIGQPNSRQSHITGLSGIIGGKGKTTTLGFPVVARKEGVVVIPAFKISTSKGEMQVPEARYQVVPARVSPQASPGSTSSPQAPSLSLDDVAVARIELERNEMWAGEVQEARLVFQGMSRYVQQFRGFEWEPKQLTLGPWQEHDEKRGMVDGNQVTVFEFPVRVQAPRQTGEYSLDPAQVGITVQSSSSNSRSPFGVFRNRGQQVTLEAVAPEITVKSLPDAPAEFSGAIGEFIISSQLVPKQTAVGEPVTWTVVLEGTGNWNDVIRLPNRQVPDGFEVIQPKSDTEMKEGSPFVGTMTEDVVLIPTKQGTFTIPGMDFIYFDTKAGEYRAMQTAAATIVVDAAKSSALSPGAQDASNDSAGIVNPMPASRAQVVPFDAQRQLPRDPMVGSLTSHRPFSLPVWACWLLLPWLVLLGLWFWLAWQQVVRLDVARSRREALQALTAWNSSWSKTDVNASSLREWQREVERLWQVSRPGAYSSQLEQAVNRQGGEGAEWAWLWSGCEGVLFGAADQLPAEWSDRFSVALLAVKLPRVKWSGWLKPQVWMPLVICALLISTAMAGSEPEETVLPNPGKAYQSGEFTKSEAALRLRLEEDWGDSAAHHDLALALFQQERWDEAAAHATVAALQSPGNGVILWDARVIAERAGWEATLTGKFFDERNHLNRIITWRSVHFWQWMGIVASLFLALSIGFGLIAAYRRYVPGRWVRWTVAIVSIVALLFSLLAVERWGMLRHPRMVLVTEELEGRSLPSEVDQQTRPLPVGTVGYFQKDFLGWRKVMLPNREEVWVRESDVLSVYPE